MSKAAKKLDITESLFVNKTLHKSLNLQPLFVELGGIGMSRKLFQRIIDEVDSHTLEIIASEVSLSQAAFALALEGKELNHSSIVWFLSEVLQTLGWFSLEELQDESKTVFVLVHKYNFRWSLFLKSCLLTLFELILESPKIEVSERIVKMVVEKRASFYRERGVEILNFN